MKESNPEKFLDTQELSALENQTLRGGMSQIQNKCKKDKDCKTKKDQTIQQ